MAKKEKITVIYIGDGEATVPGLPHLFKKDHQKTFDDPEHVAIAKNLVETNVNFKEKGDDK